MSGLAGAAGVAALASCGTGSGQAQPPTAFGEKTGSGTLDVWGGVPAESGPANLIAAFEKKYPQIKVKYTRYVNDATGQLKLDSSLQGGVPIDVFFTYDGAALTKRVTAGLATDLTDNVAADKELAIFAAGSSPVKNMVFNKKIYTVPGAVSPQVTLVNDAMLKASGITIPSDWDFATYQDVAKQLSNKGTVFGAYDAGLVARSTLGPDANYRDKGKASNFSDPAWIRQITTNVTMQKNGSSVPQQEILSQKLKTFSQAPFLSGQVGMLSGQVFLLRYISDLQNYPHDFKVRCLTSPAPSGSDEHWNPGTYGDLMSISAKTKNPDAAWTFLKFWVMNAGTHMTPGGRLPSMLDKSEASNILAGLLGPDREKLYDVESFERVLFDDNTLKVPVDTIFTGASQIALIQDKLTDQALLGDITIDEWVSEMNKQSTAAITAAS